AAAFEDDAGALVDAGADAGAPVVLCPDANDAFEPNDVPAAGTPFGSALHNVTLRICPSDVDWFLVDARAGETVVATITFAHADGNLDLLVWEADVDPFETNYIGASFSADDDEVVYHVSEG